MWNFQSGMKAAPGGSDIGWSHRAPDLWGCKQAWGCQLPLRMREWWWMVKETYEISGIWNDKIYIYMHTHKYIIYIYTYIYIYVYIIYVYIIYVYIIYTIYHISYIVYNISYIKHDISIHMMYYIIWYVTYNCFFTWAFCIHVPPKKQLAILPWYIPWFLYPNSMASVSISILRVWENTKTCMSTSLLILEMFYRQPDVFTSHSHLAKGLSPIHTQIAGQYQCQEVWSNP